MPLAELSIPRLGLSAVVLHGSDAHTLRLGLGHIENTPVPGESGNVAIAGHRDSFFRPLRNVHVGDDILLDTSEERLHYRVSLLRVVHADDTGVIGPTPDATLTLVTCYPFWFIGQAPDRFVVRATRVEDPTAAAIPDASQTPEPNREPVMAAPSTVSNGGVASRNEGDRTPKEGGAAQSIGTRPINDEARVREVLERFRLTYNSQLAKHGATGPDGFVTFDSCDVAVVAGTTATATCGGALSPSSEGVSIQTWAFELGTVGGEWTITSVSK
jgi:LPXTG-site transpeptidase (sortase) family protein